MLPAFGHHVEAVNRGGRPAGDSSRTAERGAQAAALPLAADWEQLRVTPRAVSASIRLLQVPSSGP